MFLFHAPRPDRIQSIAKIKVPKNTYRAIGKEHVVVTGKIPKGKFCGAAGSSGCVLLIAQNPARTKTVAVHFQPTDDVKATMKKLFPYQGFVPSGWSTVIAGGNNNSLVSNYTMAQLWLLILHTRFQGVYNSVSIYVDDSGNYYVNKVEAKLMEKDGTIGSETATPKKE